MDKPAITYSMLTDAAPEAEPNVLDNVYRFILDCHAKKEAAREGRPDDAKGRSKNDSRAKASIP